MEPIASTLGETITCYGIIGVALLLIPAMFTWWALAQRVNSLRREAGRQREVGRWHFLRFGPTAPLLSLTAFLSGLVPVIVGWRAVHYPIILSLAVLTVFGLVAFLMSMLLWSYASDPAEAVQSNRPKQTVFL
ncbi:hypothetical protein [Cryobacterium sp. TMT2-14]|uniref:hypothetical protein n=1 Tax=Cryobacterium sp. TMT2-14 TaxID=1259245 RepID=UPI00106C7B83|nr:hypothetical protein [Cryobacterium sp. TMT2-14]TFC39050.1 hypothetical protein E3O28_04280 [Cryobacterium sp. TMT2-14]